MNFTRAIFFTLLLLLPTQLGMHFWLPESLVLGRKIDYLSPTLFITDILLVLFVSAVFIKKILNKWNIWTLTIIVAGFLFLLMSTIDPLSAYMMLRIFWLILFAFAVISYKPKELEYKLPLLLGGVGVGLLAVLQFANQQSLGNFLYFFGERSFTRDTPGTALVSSSGLAVLRAYATFPHPNVLGGYLATTVPLLLFPLVTKTTRTLEYRFYFILKHAFFAFATIALALSFSRTAVIALFVGVGVWSCLSRSFLKRDAYKRSKLAVLVLVILVVCVSFMSFSTDKSPILERWSLAKNAIDMVAKYPYFGVGLLKFIPSIPSFGSPPHLLQPVHSIYLLIAAETGMIGLAVFLFFCFFVTRHAYCSKKHHLVSSLVIIMFCGLFDHYFITIQQTRLLLVLVVALVFVDYNKNSAKKS